MIEYKLGNCQTSRHYFQVSDFPPLRSPSLYKHPPIYPDNSPRRTVTEDAVTVCAISVNPRLRDNNTWIIRRAMNLWWHLRSCSCAHPLGHPLWWWWWFIVIMCDCGCVCVFWCHETIKPARSSVPSAGHPWAPPVEIIKQWAISEWHCTKIGISLISFFRYEIFIFMKIKSLIKLWTYKNNCLLTVLTNLGGKISCTMTLLDTMAITGHSMWFSTESFSLPPPDGQKEKTEMMVTWHTSNKKKKKKTSRD